MKTEELTDTAAGVEDVENINLRGSGDDLVTDKEGVPMSRELINESRSVTLKVKVKPLSHV